MSADLTTRLALIARRVAAAAIVVSCTGSCDSVPQAAPEPPTKVRITAAVGTWAQVGRALADAYTHRVPHTTAEAGQARGLEDAVDAVEQGRSDLAIDDAETAYFAYSQGTTNSPRPHQNVRAMSVLFSTAVQIVVRSDAGISKITDLRGHRVDVGAKGTPTERAARLILESHGLTYDMITPIFGSRGSVEALRAKQLDARFFYTPYPQATIANLAQTAGVRLLSIERRSLGAIQDKHHFLKSVVIPGGTYLHQDAPVLTVGMDVLLLCRQDLPEHLVRDLTAALFDSVPALKAANAAAGAIDPERGPTTAVPLHAGAVRYYREREILR